MEQNQSRNQRIIALAQSEHGATVVELLNYIAPREKLLGETEYATIVNAVKFDTRADMIEAAIVLIDNIKKGEKDISNMQ